MKSKKMRRHEARASFYVHMFVFVLMSSLLVGINLMFSPSVLWVLFVLLGWGSGLLIHGLAAFWESDAEPSVSSHGPKGHRASPA